MHTLHAHRTLPVQMGAAVSAESGPRERDAATFHLRRAARKLSLAQVLDISRHTLPPPAISRHIPPSRAISCHLVPPPVHLPPICCSRVPPPAISRNLTQVPANDEQMISLHHQITASEQASS